MLHRSQTLVVIVTNEGLRRQRFLALRGLLEETKTREGNEVKC